MIGLGGSVDGVQVEIPSSGCMLVRPPKVMLQRGLCLYLLLLPISIQSGLIRSIFIIVPKYCKYG